MQVVQNYKEGTQWGGTFYRKIKSKFQGIFQKIPDPIIKQKRINLNDPTNEETNKIPNVVSRK